MSLYATCICGIPEGQEGAHRTDCPFYGVIPMSGPVCRGSWALGTACRRCERCLATKPLTCVAMTDLIARLRGYKPYRIGEGEWFGPKVCEEAADELSALREALRTILGSKKSETGTWMEMVEPLIARFDVAANFGGNAVYNPEGSAALAELIRQMATRLDTSVSVARAILAQHGGEDG